MDWTFDIFFSDVEAYKNGRELTDNYTDVEFRYSFIKYLDEVINKVVNKWKSENNDHLYVNGKGWVGDEVKRVLADSLFSDFYKDTYGQRPHLPSWFYIHPFGVPCGDDTVRTFCATPIEDAIDSAVEMRENI